MELTEEEVLQILRIMDESSFDYLHLEMGDLKLSVSKSGQMQHLQDIPQAPPVASVVRAVTQEPLTPAPKAGIPADKSGVTCESAADAGLTPITAPLMGVFYSRPDPDAPPYVEVGKVVCADDTVGLIEVMKLFNSVKAGAHGTIARILVESGQLVEYGQPLFLIKPHE